MVIDYIYLNSLNVISSCEQCENRYENFVINLVSMGASFHNENISLKCFVT